MGQAADRTVMHREVAKACAKLFKARGEHVEVTTLILSNLDTDIERERK